MLFDGLKHAYEAQNTAEDSDEDSDDDDKVRSVPNALITSLYKFGVDKIYY